MSTNSEHPLDFVPLRDFLLSLPQLANEHGEAACYQQLDAMLQNLAEERKRLGAKAEGASRASFDSLILPLVCQSNFGKHLHDKPRGYPGDYLAQEMIWFGRTGDAHQRYTGTTEIGRLISALTFDMDNCRANEQRVYMLRSLVRTCGPRLASIGCGSCIELWDVRSLRSDPLDIFLLDRDQGALERARACIGASANYSTSYHCDNILRFALRPSPQRIGERDLIYLFGLLDYFSAEHAVRVLVSLRRCLASGGLMVATNAHPRNPTRFWMEYAGDWWLNYKDEQTMLGIAGQVPGLDEVRLLTDDWGVYQYLHMKANS